jgi:hypothetical protein
VDQATYEAAREDLLRGGGAKLIELEKALTAQLLKGICYQALAIKRDFDLAMELRPFWERYAPLQRGHKPRGEAFPWGEVGEKVIEACLYANLGSIFKQVTFPGIPYGHDVRFLTDEAFVQIDAKSTGPTDNIDEVVSSPNQVTGDGLFEGGLVKNTAQTVLGDRRPMHFLPELSPFVILGSKVYPVVTFYLKLVYMVIAKGNQPLTSLELVCVPNGLLMFDGPKYAETKGMLIPGKDTRNKTRKRTRIRLNPLARIADWRCVKIVFGPTGFVVKTRAESLFPLPAPTPLSRTLPT